MADEGYTEFRIRCERYYYPFGEFIDHEILKIIDSGKDTSIDLSELVYLDSWAIGRIIYYIARCEKLGTQFRLLHPQVHISKILEMVKVNTITKIEE
ncbi:MAG: hypothetical protein HRU15_06280 [Planctomycetes bacterium]|nr:hypothetical protein [Planctomycetota bacterium]